jgi:hypothetical protein
MLHFASCIRRKLYKIILDDWLLEFLYESEIYLKLTFSEVITIHIVIRINLFAFKKIKC